VEILDRDLVYKSCSYTTYSKQAPLRPPIRRIYYAIIRRRLVALHDIECGGEISFNYNDSEINMSDVFYVGDQKVCGKQQ